MLTLLALITTFAPLVHADPPLIAQQTLVLAKTAEALDEIRVVGEFPTDGEPGGTAFLINKWDQPGTQVSAAVVTERDDLIKKLLDSTHPAIFDHKMALEIGQGKKRPKIYPCNELHVDFVLESKHEKVDHEPGLCAKSVVVWLPKSKAINVFYNGKKITQECAADDLLCAPPEAPEPVSP